MRLLEERVAIITGSTKGNVRAMANLFSEHGGNVIVTGRDKNETQSVADQLARQYQTNPLGLKVDVTSATEVKDMILKVRQNYGRIDVLVNNAGYPIRDELWDVSFEQIQDQVLENVFDVDTMGTYRCCREVQSLRLTQVGIYFLIVFLLSPSLMEISRFSFVFL